MRIDVKDIVFAYKEKRILDGVSFSLVSGKSYAMMGKNGRERPPFSNSCLAYWKQRAGRYLQMEGG